MSTKNMVIVTIVGIIIRLVTFLIVPITMHMAYIADVGIFFKIIYWFILCGSVMAVWLLFSVWLMINLSVWTALENLVDDDFTITIADIDDAVDFVSGHNSRLCGFARSRFISKYKDRIND